MFALAIGCIVGSGWVVVLGEWLHAAGPGGAILGFAISGLAMLSIAAAYAEVTARVRRTGGDYVFAREAFGDRLAFAVGWFNLLFLVAVTAFEGTALYWVLSTLVPHIRGPDIYRLLGHTETAGAIVVGVGGAALLALINYRGTMLSARFQVAVTGSFLLLAALVVLIAAWHGAPAHLEPLLGPSAPDLPWVGIMWLVATSPFFLNGFQAVPQVIEERADGVSMRLVARAMYAAVIGATLFYIAIILACSMAMPWQDLVGMDLPAARAVEHLLPGRALFIALLAAAAISVIKIWNGIVVWAARLVLALARDGFLPSGLAFVHPRFGTPSRALLVVAFANVLGVLLGRGALIPLLNVTSTCVAFTLVTSTAAAWRLRRSAPAVAEPDYLAPGGRWTLALGMVSAIGMTVFAIAEPLLGQNRRLPLEWALLGGWATLGIVCYRWRIRRGGCPRPLTPGSHSPAP